jgi:hypothetical protein
MNGPGPGYQNVDAAVERIWRARVQKYRAQHAAAAAALRPRRPKPPIAPSREVRPAPPIDSIASRLERRRAQRQVSGDRPQIDPPTRALKLQPVEAVLARRFPGWPVRGDR